MLTEITDRQIAALPLSRDRPLVICDVDEVVVHFTRAFEAYLALQDLWLDPRSFAINGNIRRRATGEEVALAEVGQLIGSFFTEQTRHLEPVEGAVEWLLAIDKHADIVLLSNLPHDAAEARRENLRDHGLLVGLKKLGDGHRSNLPVVVHLGAQGMIEREGHLLFLLR